MCAKGFTTEASSYKAENGIVLGCEISKPYDFDENKSYPMLYYLHHLGGDWDRPGYNELLNIIYNQCGYDMIVIAPFANSRNSSLDADYWIDNEIVKRAYEFKMVLDDSIVSARPIPPALVAAKELLDSTKKLPYINNERIYGMGFSMGAFGIWSLVTGYKNVFTAAAPVAGAGSIRLAKNAVDVPIFAFHGDKDEIVSVECTRGMVKAIKDAGGQKIKYTEFENGGHATHHFEAFKEALKWFNEFEYEKI